MSAYASSITLLSATTMKEIGSCDLWNQITQSTDDVGQDDPYTQKQKWCLVRGVEKK
jgi:myosin-crossreactive antigen